MNFNVYREFVKKNAHRYAKGKERDREMKREREREGRVEREERE